MCVRARVRAHDASKPEDALGKDEKAGFKRAVESSSLAYNTLHAFPSEHALRYPRIALHQKHSCVTMSGYFSGSKLSNGGNVNQDLEWFRV